MLKRTIITAVFTGLSLSGLASAKSADWMHYLVRPTGLGWSDGYHAFDQCPPRQTHFPIRHGSTHPAWGAAQESHAPYYFEEPSYKADAAAESQELLPPAEGNPGNPRPINPRTPSPQARYQPRSRYFQTLEMDQQMQTARRP
jgi:hypothetical protein